MQKLKVLKNVYLPMLFQVTNEHINFKKILSFEKKNHKKFLSANFANIWFKILKFMEKIIL